METILEIITVILLDTATLLLVLHILKVSDDEKKGYRLVSGTFAVGFALGVVSECFTESSCFLMILYALGFMLAYIAFLFALPEKRKRYEDR